MATLLMGETNRGTIATMNQPQIAYISFDIVPAPKGAAIHIAAFVRALGAAFGNVELVTVSPNWEAMDPQERYPNVMQTALPAVGKTLIDRVMYFRTMLGSWFKNKRFDVVHIRSIYEGFPIALQKEKCCDRLIFEVNGLPSIELKYRYPAVADDRELLQKLHAQEQICLDAADLIITPSGVTRDYLQARQVPRAKICVIPNGVDLDIFTPTPQQASAVNLEENFPYHLIYFGTLSAWQGVNIAIEALAQVNERFPAKLTAIGQARSQQIERLQKLANKLGVSENLRILSPMSQGNLVQQIHQADAIVAPLTPNDRNLIQGCCPLKVLEGMATATPTIATNLPVVREIGGDREHFLLVKPGSAGSLKDAIVEYHFQPQFAARLARNARQRIETHYTWQQAGDALIAAYHRLGIQSFFCN